MIYDGKWFYQHWAVADDQLISRSRPSETEGLYLCGFLVSALPSLLPSAAYPLQCSELSLTGLGNQPRRTGFEPKVAHTAFVRKRRYHDGSQKNAATVPLAGNCREVNNDCRQRGVGRLPFAP